MTDAGTDDTTHREGRHRPAVSRRVLGAWLHIPLLVRAATGAFAALIVGFMFLYPVNYGFDEPQHFDMAYAFATGHGVYAPGKRIMDPGVLRESQTYAIGYPPRSAHFDDHPLPPRPQRESIDDLAATAAPSRVPNQMVQHPPLYYLAGAAVLDIPGVRSLAFDIQFGLVRLLSLLLLLPLPWLCYASARRIGVGVLAPAASLVPLIFPALARSGASVTNDSMLNLTVGLALYLVTRVVTGDASRKTAVGLGVATFCALLTKGFALVLPAIVVLAYLLCRLRFPRTPVLTAGAIAVAGSAAGGMWWLHNLVAYGTVQPSGYPPGYVERIYDRISPGAGTGGGHFVHVFGLDIAGRFWGSIGLIESPDYNWTFITIGSVVLLALLAGGVARGTGDRLGPWAVALPLSYPVFVIAVLVGPAWHAYQRWDIVPGVQGRYLSPAIVPMAATALLALERVVPTRVHRFVPAVIVLVAMYAQLWTLRAVAHAWWFGATLHPALTEWGDTIRAALARAPWPSAVSIIAAILSGSAVVNLLVCCARRPVEQPEPAKAPAMPMRQDASTPA
jgi:4-amino-4-deoxy-L-arabinose transferase-like glycosyltransferase